MSADAAPYRRRVLAYAVDAAIALTPVWLAIPIGVMLLSSADGAQHYAAAALLPVAFALSAFAYLAANTLQAVRRHPTVGQRAAKIRVVTVAGAQPMSPLRGAARELACRLVWWGACLGLGLLPLLAVDAIWCLIDPSARSLRDRVAQTSVVSAGDCADDTSEA